MKDVMRTEVSRFFASALMLLAGSIGCSGGGDAASLNGDWELVSTYKAATQAATPSPSGAVVAQFQDGTVKLYLTAGATKTCGTGTYTLSGQTLTFGSGGSTATIAVTSTTLKVTTTVAGGAPYFDMPGDVADYTRLATFDTSAFGACP
jgi:hypothetical protein